MLKKTSISDIAKEINVSPALVPLVINGKAREKRINKKIELKVKKLDPSPNQKEFKHIILPTGFNIRESCDYNLKNR